MRTLAIIGILMAASGYCANPLDRDAVIQLVITKFVPIQKLTHEMSLFIGDSTLVPGDIITPALGREESADETKEALDQGKGLNFLDLAMEPVADPEAPTPERRRYEITAEVWFVFIDDDPRAEFSHPVRFVFIDPANGDTAVFEEDWWAELNGVDTLISEEDTTDLDKVIFSTVHLEL